MSKGSAAKEAFEEVAKKGGKKAAEKAAAKKARIAEEKRKAEEAKTKAEAAKRGILGRGWDYTKAHPGRVAAGTGGVAAGGFVLGTALGGGGEGDTVTDVLPAPSNPTLPRGSGGGAGGVGGDYSAGIVEWDADNINALIGSLRQEATALEPLLTSGPAAFEAFRAELAADSLHTRTRSGGPSPVLAPLDDAVVLTANAYTEVVQGLIAQLTGDADRLTDILAEYEENEAENVASINSIDTEGL